MPPEQIRSDLGVVSSEETHQVGRERAGNIIVYTPIQGTNREKYFNHDKNRRKMPNLAGNEHFSIHLYSHRPRFSVLRRKI